MRTIQGPALFLSQFIADRPPFDTLDGLAGWAAGLGFRGLQIPIHDPRILDVARLADDPGAAAALREGLAARGLVITELNASRAGHLMVSHPAYDAPGDLIAPPEVRGDRRARQGWARRQLSLALRAARHLGVARVATFSGGLLWPYAYPYPARPADLVERGFDALASAWRPVLDEADALGVDLCYELHPGEDLHDGVTFDAFLARLDGHRRARLQYDPSHMHLQHMDYLGFLDLYHPRIAAFHVKDAEFVPSARSGAWGGYQDWPDRPGRFRTPGDGQLDFRGIFDRLARHGYAGWAVLEWEDWLRHPEDGARLGARFITEHIVRVTDRPFDAAARRRLDGETVDRMLGLRG